MATGKLIQWDEEFGSGFIRADDASIADITKGDREGPLRSHDDTAWIFHVDRDDMEDPVILGDRVQFVPGGHRYTKWFTRPNAAAKHVRRTV
jgi:hypothetical protein